MKEKIVECPRCGKEIPVSFDVVDDLVFVQQEDIDLQPEYFESELENDENE